MPTIVYRASFIVRRRTSCTDNRRELFYAYNNQPSASYHLCPCSIDGIGGIGILITTIRRWVYDRRHITAIVGEAKCIIPLRNHSTIHKLMQTQQSTELHILIAAPPPLWCDRHRNDDKHNNMPTIRCIRKHSEGGRVHVGVVHCVPCSIYHRYLQQPNRLAIEHTTIN